MPELPEVEVCRRGLAPELVGALIEGVDIRAPKLRHEIPPALRELLPGCRVLADPGQLHQVLLNLRLVGGAR